MRPTRSLALAALVLAAGSCRSVARVAYATLETRASAPVVYEAELSSRAVRVSDLGRHWTPPADSDGDEGEQAESSDTLVDVRARIVSMRTTDAAGAFGYRPHGKQAVVVDRAAVQRLIDQLVADGLARDVSAPRLATRAGVTADISSISEIAYIQGFRVEAADNLLIADPNVAVAQDGVLLSVVPTPIAADGTIDLSIELVTASLARPIEAIQARIPGSAVPVTIQTPVTMSQKLATVVRLAADEALVLGGLAGDAPDEFLFAIVTAERLVMEESAPRADVDR